MKAAFFTVLLVVPAWANAAMTQFDLGSRRCVATLVGDRVVVTAGYCLPLPSSGGDPVGYAAAVSTTGSSTVKFGGSSYNVEFEQAPDINTAGNMLAIGLLDRAVSGVYPLSIDDSVDVGDELTLRRVNKKALESFKIEVTTLTNQSFYASVPSRQAVVTAGNAGAAIVNSAGALVGLVLGQAGSSLQDVWALRLGGAKSQQFLRDFASQKGVEICGINRTCSNGP